MTPRPFRVSFTITILILFAVLFVLAVGLVVLGFRQTGARAAPGPAAFVCATNVLNGRLRVFERRELSAAAVMASACLPQLFQAVEVEGEHYWDGGFSGNPPIFPLIYMGGCQDIVIVQLNPINIPRCRGTCAPSWTGSTPSPSIPR